MKINQVSQLFLVILYFLAVIFMEGFFNKIFIESLVLTSPILGVGIWLTILLNKTNSDNHQAQRSMFRSDLYTMLVAFIIGSFLTTIINLNNSDMRGWWILWLYFMFAFGALYAFIFSFIKKIFSNHSGIYTIIYALIVLGAFIVASVLPLNVTVFSTVLIDTFYLLFSALLGFHIGISFFLNLIKNK